MWQSTVPGAPSPIDNLLANPVAPLMLLFFVGLIYFLPSVIAYQRHHQSLFQIFILNLLTSFTIVGWIVALVWACSEVREREVVILHSTTTPR
jgi:threonine/homoserine/homoserine lactone efflux protein